MKKTKVILLIFTICVITFSATCKKKKDTPIAPPDSSFDKSGMLNNIGEYIITPAYANLKTATDSLQFYSDLFIATPSLTTLTALQNSFSKAYLSYQYVSTFEFGAADSELIRANFNTFPCDTTQINTKISSGDLTLTTIADLDAKGFPALDFLLFRSGKNNNYIVSLFTTHTSATNAKNYLSALVNELKTKTNTVHAAWNPSGGNYSNTFNSSTGNDVGSSTGILINQLNFDLEILKNARIGIPLGKKTDGAILPEKVEAYYSKQSLSLLIAHMKSLENIYLGRNSNNENGLGLDDYLVFLKAQHATGSLNDAIKNKFTSVITKLNAIPDPLSATIVSNPAIIDLAYAEILQLTVLLKVDLPAATGVLITYADNDGD